jgi:hypothetical protein
MTELRVQTPLLEEVASTLEAGGAYQGQLTGQDVAGIMRGVVDGLLSGQDQVRASVPSMDVRIENNRGSVQGTVQVESPMKFKLGIGCVLGNDRDNRGCLSLVDFKLSVEGGMGAKLALKAINLEGKAREALSDPNRALVAALDDQLKDRGLKISEFGATFNNNVLQLGIRGRRI